MQNTAYEMRISNWISDVCSSGLLDRHVLEHVAQPGALAFAHAADEAARFAVRSAVFGQARQRLDQGVDEGRAQLPVRPGFERAQVELEPDDREMRIQRRADVDGTVQDTHRHAPLSFSSCLPPMYPAKRGACSGRTSRRRPGCAPSGRAGTPAAPGRLRPWRKTRSEEHTSELQSLM